jgi:hypothetical protein
MSLYDSPSDLDYQDSFGPRPVRCQTSGCDRAVTFPDFEVFCSGCLQAHADASARRDAANALHRSELEAAGPVKVRGGDRRLSDRRTKERRSA